MNTTHTNENSAQHDRAIGYWLRTIDHLIARRMRESIAETGLRRGDWRLLRLLATEPRSADNLRATLPPQRRGAGPRFTHRLGSFLERGWISSDEHGILSLTEAGRAQHEQLRETMREFRASVSEGISPDDWDTTLTSLETVARNLGWDGSAPKPGRGGRGHRSHQERGGRRRFGRGHGHPRRGFAPDAAPGFEGGLRRAFRPEEHAHREHEERERHGQRGHGGRLHRPDARMPLCGAEHEHGRRTDEQRGGPRRHDAEHRHARRGGEYRGPRER